MNIPVQNSLFDRMVAVMNRVRTINGMFPEFFASGKKHDHYADFGYPATVTFQDLYQMYSRNGLAAAAIKKIKTRSWHDDPEIREDLKAGDLTKEEQLIRDHFIKIRFWQNCAEADMRSMVGGYGALILRVADNEAMNTELLSMRSIEDIVEVIPAWMSQLEVSDWDNNVNSQSYGKPLAFLFNETSVGAKTQGGHQRQFKVHPSRVIIFSSNGTTQDRSLLEPIFNDLIDLEKIKGAGAEGFYKNSKSAPVLSMDKDAKIASLAEAMGVKPTEVADKMQEVVEDWNKGFDASLFMQGIDAKFPQISLPAPKEFYAMHLQSVSAALEIPLKILVGSQSGQRASTEDAKEFDKTIGSRRNKTLKPIVSDFVQRMVDAGAIGGSNWKIHWDDLTETTAAEKMNKAKTLSAINHEQADEIFDPSEIREAAGYEAELPSGYGATDA